MLDKAIKILREKGNESINITTLGNHIGYVISNCPKEWSDDKIVECGVAIYNNEDLSKFKS